jgi:predicted secreted protein
MKMKFGLTIFLIATILLVLVSGCSPNNAQYAIVVPYEDFAEVQGTISRHVTESLNVPINSSFTVTLWSNQTTGFKWSESATIEDQTIVQQTNHKYLAPEDEEIVGAAGNEIWTFTTLINGTTTLYLEYSQPWDGGQKDAFGFFLSIVVI